MEDCDYIYVDRKYCWATIDNLRRRRENRKQVLDTVEPTSTSWLLWRESPHSAQEIFSPAIILSQHVTGELRRPGQEARGGGGGRARTPVHAVCCDGGLAGQTEATPLWSGICVWTEDETFEQVNNVYTTNYWCVEDNWYSRHYFVLQTNPGEQFYMFTSLCAWLIRKLGETFSKCLLNCLSMTI